MSAILFSRNHLCQWRNFKCCRSKFNYLGILISSDNISEAERVSAGYMRVSGFYDPLGRCEGCWVISEFIYRVTRNGLYRRAGDDAVDIGSC